MKLRAALLLSIPFVLALGVLRPALQDKAPEEAAAPLAADSETPPVAVARSAPQISARKIPNPVPVKHEVQVESLHRMTEALAQFEMQGHNLPGMLGFLSQARTSPFLAVSGSEEVGQHVMVRTRSPLPGTRYFQAQFEGSGKEAALQRISFQFAPGRAALEEATDSMKRSFHLGAPTFATAEFRRWKRKDGTVVSVERLSAEDLANNSYLNASDPHDVGAVEVIIERDQGEEASI